MRHRADTHPVPLGAALTEAAVRRAVDHTRHAVPPRVVKRLPDHLYLRWTLAFQQRVLYDGLEVAGRGEAEAGHVPRVARDVRVPLWPFQRVEHVLVDVETVVMLLINLGGERCK